MKKLFLDTNFICDYFLRPEFFEISEEFIKIASLKDYDFVISYLSVANFAYIIRKENLENIYKKINLIISNFNILSNTKDQIKKALALSARDFEDGLQYQTALANDCDFIITRNQKDFEFSKIPVLSASEFLEKYLS